MWEAVAAPGRLAELVAFADLHAHPGAELYCSADERLVMIDPSGVGLPEVPTGLTARPPHQWTFEQIRRG